MYNSVITMTSVVVAVIYCVSPELILNHLVLGGKAAEYPHSNITFLLDCDVKRDALWEAVI